MNFEWFEGLGKKSRSIEKSEKESGSFRPQYFEDFLKSF